MIAICDDALHVFEAGETGTGSGNVAQLVKRLARMHKTLSVFSPQHLGEGGWEKYGGGV